MAAKTPTVQPQEAVRFSRIMPFRWAVALGASVSIGLSIFTLLGVFAREAGPQTLGIPFLFMGIAAIPLVLTYAERGAVLPGSGGAYNLARPGGRVWLMFANGWLLLGGYAVLAALLGWGVALQLNLLFTRFFEITLNQNWLAVAVIGIMALNSILGTKWAWHARSRYIFLSIAFVAGFAIVLWINPAPGASAASNYFRGSAAIFRLATLMFSSLWGLHFILNARDEIQRPTRTVPRSMGAVVLVTVGVGLLAGAAVSVYGALPETLVPLIEIQQPDDTLLLNLATILYAAAGLVLTSIALNQSLVNALQTTGEMVRDGFFPDRLQSALGKNQVPLLTLLLFAIASQMLIVLFSAGVLVGVASTTFLWATALVHLPDAFRASPGLPENRFLKLPFHPLFPWLTIVIGFLFPWYLDWSSVIFSALWLAAGAAVYLLGARRGGLAAHRQGVVIGEISTARVQTESTFVVLVAIDNPNKAADLLHAGVKIAAARNGSVLALRIVSLAEQIPAHIKRQQAEAEWESLAALTQTINAPGVNIRPLVRLAPSPVSGILEAISEERANLLVLGWQGTHTSGETPTETVIDPLLKRARCEVVVIRGRLPDSAGRYVIPTAGGPHAAAGLALGRDLGARQAELPDIIVEHILPDSPTPEDEQTAQDVLAAARRAAKNGIPLQTRQINAPDIADGILTHTRPSDVLFIGASNQGFLDRAVFGGIAAEIAAQATVPAATILTRSRQQENRVWLRQSVEFFIDALPSLTAERRNEVYTIMKESAQPSVDFFVLITLAAVIASLGLLQNSAAVIIGAMLVAPLMSPILAMAMSMVHGNLQLLRVAAEATTKGIVLAIVVGVVVTLVSPLQTATTEILARTQPNLLDLLVALASGAAAGYAISRKEVAAALPGVAIAAALVPPLCVVGYGIGTAQLSVAGGSLLLFTTNLIAIVLSAAGTFLALGFHPTRTDRRELMRGLRVTFISLGVVAVILLVTTVATVRSLNRQVKIDALFENEIVSRSSYVLEKTITRENGRTVISAIIVDILGNQLTPAQISQIADELTDIAGGPVSIDAIVIPGYTSDFEDQPQRQRLHALFAVQIQQLNGQIDWSEVTGNSADGFTIFARIIALEDEIGPAEIENIQNTLTDVIESAVTIKATILAGQRIIVEPTPTPTPTPEP